MKPLLALTLGDPAGIGPEIIVKALADESIYEICTPFVVGDVLPLVRALTCTGLHMDIAEIASPVQAKNQPGVINLMSCGLITQDYPQGRVDVRCGDAAYQYVIRAAQTAMRGGCDAIVTAPINKQAINEAGHKFAGHTEILAHVTGTDKFGMLLSGGGLNVVHVTTHVSLRQACENITRQRVLDTIYMADLGMRLLGKEKPRIAVAGLNPHCSENGLFGSQEAEHIEPAVRMAQAEMDVSGPLPADTVFARALSGEFDIVVAMYHDQGHIPIKLLAFRDAEGGRQVGGINCTIGLPIIRTSVDHGTAFDLAGTGKASGQSMIDAIRAAATMALNWKP